MPDLAQAAPQKAAGSFAALLSSLTKRLDNDEWDDAPLGDDVVSLTYEQALRSTDQARMPGPATYSLPDKLGRLEASPHPQSKPQIDGEKKQRSASITVRVTAQEQAQLHDRAAEARLSVSAYLRSCIFEAESLRTQVKEALERMQKAQTAAAVPIPKRIPYWRRRLFSRWPRNQHSAD